ncbi:MAG: hypothetical protein ACFBQW_00650 [Sphingomonadaceae bacterium]
MNRLAPLIRRDHLPPLAEPPPAPVLRKYVHRAMARPPEAPPPRRRSDAIGDLEFFLLGWLGGVAFFGALLL